MHFKVSGRHLLKVTMFANLCGKTINLKIIYCA